MLGNPEQGTRVCGRRQPDISVRVSYASFPLKPDSSLGVFVAMVFRRVALAPQTSLVDYLATAASGATKRLEGRFQHIRSLPNGSSASGSSSTHRQVNQTKSAQSDVQMQDKCPVGYQGLNHVLLEKISTVTWTVITVEGALLSS